MALTLHGVIADAIVGFQTIPGVDAASLIQAGPAKKKNSDGTTTDIPSQGGGFYCFKMGADSSLDFELLGTDYTLQHHSTANTESNPAGSSTIAVWKDLGAKNSLEGVQRRLQILGYYQGIVDGIRGRKTEEATLSFQADNTLRTDGLDTDATTKNKLETICTGSDVELVKITPPLLPIIRHVVRRTLVKFERAPKPLLPYSLTPEIDDRGFIQRPTMGQNINGPVVTMVSDAKFCVQLRRVAISNDAELEAVVSSGATSLTINTPNPLPKIKKVVLKLSAKNKGNTKIEIKCKHASGTVVIARLYIIVLEKITLNVRPYWLTIGKKRVDGTIINKISPLGRKKAWKYVFRRVNQIWKPYGIFFNFKAFLEKTVALSTPGQLSKNAAGQLKPEFDKIVNDVAAAKNAINVFIVKEVQDYVGIAFTTSFGAWPNGIVLEKNSRGLVAAANDLAHELGHMLSLANLGTPTSPKYNAIHADDDPSSANKKEDRWSLKKLMYSYNPYNPTRPSDTWVQDVGYGRHLRGAMVTVRDLSNDNDTDGECKRARDYAASDARVYHNP